MHIEDPSLQSMLTKTIFLLVEKMERLEYGQEMLINF